MPDINLIHGDCFKHIETMDNNIIDLVLTDPPYGMDFQSNARKEKHKKIQGDTDLFWLPNFIKQIHRITKENAHIYMFCSWHKVEVFKMELEKYFKIKNMIVWAKPGGGMGDLNGGYAGTHEICFFINRGKDLKGKRDGDVISKAYRTGNSYHPTQKPVNLMEYFIDKSSESGDLVFDPFSGSGSTALACYNTGRDFIGCELDDDFYNISKRRIEEAMNQLKLFTT